MSRRPLLAFFVSGGRREGLGHVLRCAALAREALSLGGRVEFRLAGDESARRVAAAELPQIRIATWAAEGRLEPGVDWAIFDTRRPLDGALGAERIGAARSLVLDRTDRVDEADLSILPVMHLPACRHPRVRQGARYCVIADSLRAIRPPRCFAWRRRLVVSLGGADPHDASSRVASDLARSLEQIGPRARPASIDFVLGPACASRPGLEERIVERGWNLHRAPSREAFAALLAEARLAILGFGTAVYEAAYLATPALWVTHHAEDRAHARRLERAGFGRFGACAGAYRSAPMRARLAAFLGDQAALQRASRSGRARLGDGRGARRILELLADEWRGSARDAFAERGRAGAARAPRPIEQGRLG